MEDPLVDEEVLIETVNDEMYDGEPVTDQEQPQPPSVVSSYLDYFYYSVLRYFTNPWAFLILMIVLYKLFGKLRGRIVDPLLDRYYMWKEEKAEAAEAARYKKNPDEYRNRMEAMELARAKLQADYETKTAEWAAKKAIQEEQKREQDIKDWELHQQGKGYKSRAPRGVDSAREALEKQAALKNKKGFKPERNPLMDLGSGSSFRPARRGFSGGGGG